MAATSSLGRATGVEPYGWSPATEAARGMYERHFPRVLRYCLFRLGRREEAEDAAQTVFLHVVRALRAGVVPVSESAWLLKIAKNVCRTHWHTAGRGRRFELARDPRILDEISGKPDGEREELIGLEEALARLPDRQRQAILFREWQGLSYAEIAQELGVTQAAVETLIFRARRSLAEELEGQPKAGRARALDLGALAGLKSALGGGSALKAAAVAAALLSASVLAGKPLAERLGSEKEKAPASSLPVANVPTSGSAVDFPPALLLTGAGPGRPLPEDGRARTGPKAWTPGAPPPPPPSDSPPVGSGGRAPSSATSVEARVPEAPPAPAPLSTLETAASDLVSRLETVAPEPLPELPDLSADALPVDELSDVVATLGESSPEAPGIPALEVPEAPAAPIDALPAPSDALLSEAGSAQELDLSEPGAVLPEPGEIAPPSTEQALSLASAGTS